MDGGPFGAIILCIFFWAIALCSILGGWQALAWLYAVVGLLAMIANFEGEKRWIRAPLVGVLWGPPLIRRFCGA